MIELRSDYDHDDGSKNGNQFEKLGLKCVLDQRQLFDLKESHLKLQVQYSQLKERYIAIHSQQEFKLFNDKHYQTTKQFLNQELVKATLKSQEIQSQKQISDEGKFKQMKAQITDLKRKLAHAQKLLNFTNLQLQKMKNKNRQILEQCQAKLKDKDKAIKILFGKISTLQKTQSKDSCNSRNPTGFQVTYSSQEVQTDQVKFEKTEFKHQLSDVTNMLLDQLLHEYYETFIKGVFTKNDQPSLTHFKNNLATIDSVRLKPYCKSLQTLLKHQSQIEINPKELNQKERWVIKSLQSLACQLDENDINKKLKYLFRLSSLYYRVQYSISSPNTKISLKLFTKVKILLFNAFFSYDALKSSKQMQKVDYTNDVI